MAWSEWQNASGYTITVIGEAPAQYSRAVQTFNVASVMDNYTELTKENFFIVPTGLSGYWVNDSISRDNVEVDFRSAISYNASTGVLTVPASRYITSATSGANDIIMKYRVYCVC